MLSYWPEIYLNVWDQRLVSCRLRPNLGSWLLLVTDPSESEIKEINLVGKLILCTI